MGDPVQVHVVPETASDERMHDLSDACWCGPLNEFVSNEATRRNDWRITHKAARGASATSPEPETAEPASDPKKWPRAAGPGPIPECMGCDQKVDIAGTWCADCEAADD